MSIKHWPADDRPREKLIERGAATLTDAELLAIFLRVGIVGKSAVELARDLLDRFGSLGDVVNASCEKFCDAPGMGEAKFAQLQASVEMARRVLAGQMRDAPVMSSTEVVNDFLRLSIGHERVEVFVALWLDAKNRLIEMQTLFRGTLMQTSVYPREVVRAALDKNAASVVFAHNHPSGNATPSQSDHLLTRTLKAALALIDVSVIDHCIVGVNRASSAMSSPPTVYSMAKMGEI